MQAAAVESVEQKAPTLVRALRVEIAKPISDNWDTIGPMLRALRLVCSRMTNAATLDVIMAVRSGGKAAPYQAALSELAGAQEHTKNDILKKLPVSSRVTDACQQRGNQAARRWLKNPGAGRIPSDKPRGPIYVRDGGWAIQLVDGLPVLEVALFGKKRTLFALRPSTGTHWGKVKQLASGNVVKLGDCKVVYDEHARRQDGSHGKWFAILAYQEVAPTVPAGLTPGRMLFVHRGMHNMLTIASSDKPSRTRRVKGFKYLSQRRKLNERARQMRMISKEERGSGAKGHGTQRRFETHDALDNKLKSINKTLCQQIGAMVARLAIEWGCEGVVIEDYGGIEPSEDRGVRRFVERFPFYQLKESIAWALRKRGLPLHEVASEYVSQTCINCGNVDSLNHNHRTGVFSCRACEFKRDADWAALAHMMRASNLAKQLEAELTFQKELGKKMRDAQVSATGEPEGQKRPTPRRKREGSAARESGKRRNIPRSSRSRESQQPPSGSSSRAGLSAARKAVPKPKKGKKK